MMPRPLHRRHFLFGAAGLAGAAVLSACAPGEQPTASTTPPPADKTTPTGTDSTPAGSTEPAPVENIELVVWDQEVRGSQNDALVALNKAFEAKYPNIKIKRTSQSFDDLRKQLALALSGSDVPDVVQVNNARGDMGQFVKAGQLLDLAPYVDQYKWGDRFPTSVLSKARYSADGKTFGDGNLYGLPQTGEIVGIFYSQKKLDAIGGKLPATWDEYFALLDTALAKGEQPMVLGNIEKWPAGHVFGPLQAHYVAPDEITKLGMGNAGASWTDEPNTKAMEKFKEWGDKKYFGSSPNGTDYDPAWTDFTKGTGVFLPGGSWLGADMEAAMGDDLRFMAPPPGVDGKVNSTGATGQLWSIPAKAKHAEAAAQYMEFVTTEDAMKVIAENGGMPVLNTAALAPAKGVQKDIYEAFESVSKNGTLLPYLDWATPTFGDTLGAGLQEALGGQKSAADVLKDLEADYKAFIGG